VVFAAKKRGDLDWGNLTCNFLFQLFKSLNMSLRTSQSEHRNLRIQKSDKIGTRWFLEKAIWRVKSRCLEIFPGMFHKKFEARSADVCKILLQDQSDTSHAVSQVEFFSKIYRASRCGCQIAVVAAKNGKEIFIFCNKLFSLSSPSHRSLVGENYVYRPDI